MHSRMADDDRGWLPLCGVVSSSCSADACMSLPVPARKYSDDEMRNSVALPSFHSFLDGNRLQERGSELLLFQQRRS